MDLTEDIKIIPLKIFQDHRGSVMKMIDRAQPHFQGFAEVYFSTINPGVVKGWKKHNRHAQNLVVVEGKVLLVLYDNREGSATKGQFLEITLGRDNYQLVQIPVNVVYAFKALGETHGILANCISEIHDSSEGETYPLEAIPYQWN
jgi:dTDP-4-dehydrorhamnose 3,5-epimerase